MTDKEVKLAIQFAIKDFSKETLTDQAIHLFKTLGYNTERQNPFPQKSYNFFKESFLDGDSRFNQEKALVKEWKSVDLLFQLTRDEVSDQKSIFNTGKVKWEGEDKETVIETYLFFAIELIKTDYSRSALAQITREINKIFPMPVMLLFKYGEHLTLSVINRRLHKKDEQKDVLEKVTLIKDISTQNPHRAHLEILFDLSFDELKRLHKFTNFVELHNAWQKTLDTKELNKIFYQKLFNWYLWALKHVKFPQIRPKSDVIKESLHQSESLIRLITRLLFVWFMKEKRLVNSDLFDIEKLKTILKDFKGVNGETTIYYKAILQNLFFATLNNPIKERKVINKGFNPKEYGDPLVYRFDELFREPDNILEHFKDIPFLNGGLFECLDQKKDNENLIEIRLDGFSTTTYKQVIFPDKLFFGKYKNIDLSGDYNDNRKKYLTVFGIIDILNQYKFTIEENTPIEEEIALDPELLGKVFENLLASYIPETKTTARKQTGSFYTPREIVNYMVDESLVAYLKNHINDEARIRKLFSLSNENIINPFTKTETVTLLKAIDNCKVLDPACGSGAFPMGVLHKMIHVLHKLDPENELWLEMVVNNVPKYLQSEFRARLKKENWNYVRKLGIIQQCIYGVDIQPIATQIAKLRFFISLLVDQTEKPNEPNRGIEPLPNLDFKIVTANTLISAPQSDEITTGGLFENQTDLFFEKFNELTYQFFNTSKPNEKKELRRKITALIKNKTETSIKQIENNFKTALDSRFNKVIEKKNKKIIEKKEWEISLWQSYTNLFKHESVGFFEPRYFFPMAADGFNVVIGNPPYIFTRDADFSEDFKRHITKQYFALLAQREIKSRANQSGKINLFALFILRGIFDSHENGILCYIVPNNLLRTTTYDLVRKYLLENSKVEEIVDLGSDVFDNVTASTIIFRISKSKINKNHRSRIITNIIDLEKSEFNKSEILQSQFLKNESYTINIFSDKNIESIISQLNQSHKYLKDDFEICAGGIATGHDKTESISNRKINEKYKPLIEGKDVKAFFIKYRGLFIEYDRKKLYRAREEFIFLLPEKLVTQRIGGGKNPLVVAYDDKQFYTFNSTNTIYSKANSKTKIKYLLAILNSRLLNWFYSTQFSNKSNLTVNISKTFLDKIPIANTSRENEDIVVFIVNYILLLKKNILNEHSIFFERLIDTMIYELYFPEEIKAAGAEVLKHLIDLPELKDDWSDEKKLKTIEEVYKKLSDPKHPVSIAMEKQKTVPEVRIIERGCLP